MVRIVFLNMNSRTFFIALSLLVYLGAERATRLCAGPNDQAVSAPAAAKGTDPVTKQLASAQLGDATDSRSDSARKLSANDMISVTVYQEDELKTETLIDKNGMVMLPLLGQVRIGGMTTEQASARIQQLYDKDYLVNPKVNLIVQHFAERRFAVLGQVQHPGNFDFPQNESVNLMEAIAISGGYTRLGAPSKVSVRRLENGSPKIFNIDAGEMSKDPLKKPFEVLPGDIITVGERTF
jgi:protein involved in polysaccharide export with SLBB domain